MTVSEPKHEPWCASVERPFDAVMRRGPYPCDCKRAEPSRGAPDAIAKLRAARTAWHEKNGVPISLEYANFLTAIGEVEDGHVVLLEAIKVAKREMVGLAAYMETSEPSVIVDNLPSLAKALNLKVDEIEAAIQKAGGI